jgi:Xaa-Pro aminopeptidase
MAFCLSGAANVVGQSFIGPEQVKRNLIREAAQITDIGMEAARNMLERAWTENITEAMVAQEVRDVMTDGGSNPYVEAFPPLVISGNDTALPHGDGSDDSTNEILPGEVVVIDIGARFKGWCADETRTFYMGDDPPQEFLEVYAVVKEAHDMAAAAFRIGNVAWQVDKVARDIIDAAGYGENFTHCAGHGVGVYIHMPPMICPGRNDPIMAWSDQVVTMEPGIYLEGQWGVRIEDDYAIRRSGPEQYTHFPDDLDTVLVGPPMNFTPDSTDRPSDLNSLDIWDGAKLAFLVIAAVGVVAFVWRRLRRRGLRLSHLFLRR